REAEAVGAQVVPIWMDALAGPCTGQAKLPPRADILITAAGTPCRPLSSLPPACTLRAEYSIELLDREAGQRILLVHKDHIRGHLRRLIEGARSHNDLQRIVSINFTEGERLHRPTVVAHQAEIRHSRVESSDCRRTTGQHVREAKSPLLLVDAEFPGGEHLQHRLIAPDPNLAELVVVAVVFGKSGEVLGCAYRGSHSGGE